MVTVTATSTDARTTPGLDPTASEVVEAVVVELPLSPEAETLTITLHGTVVCVLAEGAGAISGAGKLHFRHTFVACDGRSPAVRVYFPLLAFPSCAPGNAASSFFFSPAQASVVYTSGSNVPGVLQTNSTLCFALVICRAIVLLSVHVPRTQGNRWWDKTGLLM